MRRSPSSRNCCKKGIIGPTLLIFKEFGLMARSQNITGYENFNRIAINVSGMKFETYEKTLARLPDSVLGSPVKRAPFYRSLSNEYFFDRNKEAFDSILFYYQSGATDSGILVKPDGIPWNTFESEVKFFELGQDAEGKIGLQPEDTRDRNDFEPATSVPITCCHNFLSKFASLFEPNRRNTPSSLHRVMDYWVIFITIFFVVLLCSKTILLIGNFLNNSNCCDQTGKKSEAVDRQMVGFLWSFCEKLCVSWFALEYFARAFCAIDKKMYLFSAQGVFDLLSFLPYLLLVILRKIVSFNTEKDVLERILLFSSFFSVFKLTRYSLGLQILMKTIQTSIKEFAFLLVCVAISLVLFSSVVYYCETNDESSTFTSIPATFWFIIVTMTTVGYGDMTPTTTAGKTFSALCAVCGVCCILAIPSTIIVSNFNSFYLRQKATSRQPKRTKRSILGRQKWFNRFRSVSL